MEKRLNMTVTLTVDDYTRGIYVGDLLSEIIENLSCLTEGVYAVHTDYTLNGKTRDEAMEYTDHHSTEAGERG